MKNTLIKTVAIFALLLVLLGIYAGIRHFQKQLPPPPGIDQVKPSTVPVQEQEKTVRRVDFKFLDGEHEIKFNQVPLVVKKEGIEGDILKSLVEKIPELASATMPSQHQKAAPGDFDRLVRGDEIEQVDREKTLQALEVALKQAQDAATITVPLAKKPGDGPESFNNKRKEMGFNTLIASFTTFHEGHVDDENRNVNLKIAVEKIDGLIIQPGKKFSFNKVVGPRTEKCGFKKAGVISQGKVIPGLGGGICQVSTTLYRSVLLGGMKIDERHNHSIYDGIEYADRGLDAAVAWGYKDFRFTNTLDLPILISAKSEPGKVFIELYAEKLPYESVELVTRNEQKHPFRVEKKKNARLKKGENRVVHPGVHGYTIESYRLITQNGETREEKLSKDRYLTFNRIEEINN